MKSLLAVLVTIIAFRALAGVPASAPLSAARQFQESIALAREINIYEGLPHQMFESASLKEEMKRSDTTQIAKFPFYIPPIVAKDDQNLRTILSAPASLVAFGGEKMCGGFHPDYCVSWEVDGKTFNALVCFGCHEILLETGGKSFRYDLTKDAYDGLRKALSPFRLKRPVRNAGQFFK